MGIERIAILGDGPAGATLGTLLARRGRRVALFAGGRPGGLVVGESLVPAVVPLLRELGIEEQVRGYAEPKPGASFRVREGDPLEIDFAEACTRVPGYAYHVPRDRFDATLLEASRGAGVCVIQTRADLIRDAPSRPGSASETTRAELDAASGGAARRALGGPPDFLVDATGRSRLFARRLALPSVAGPRRDEALFAHWKGVPIERRGHIHTDRLERGWCWRIPLPGRVSLGVVAPREATPAPGRDAEARYRALLDADPHLKELVAGARCITPVMRYDNYQLTTTQAVGPRWALVGDAFGFVDPVFSSGLYLAMAGAAALCEALVAGGGRALARYEREHRRHLTHWQEAADLFYDGRFFALLRLRAQRPEGLWRRMLHDHVSRHVPRMFTGEGSRGGYSRRLLALLAARGLAPGREPEVR